MGSLKSPWVMLVLFVGLSALIEFFAISSTISSHDPVTLPEANNTIFQPLAVTALLLAVLGTGAFTSEFRHGTLTTTYGVAPRRDQVAAAKAIVYGLVSAAAATVAVGIIVVMAAVRFEGLDLGLGDPTTRRFAVGAVAYCLFNLFVGFGVGALVRKTAAAITITLLWPTVVTATSTMLPAVVQRLTMPFAVAQVLIGPASNEATKVTPWEALGAMGVWAAAIALFGCWLINRADVT